MSINSKSLQCNYFAGIVLRWNKTSIRACMKNDGKIVSATGFGLFVINDDANNFSSKHTHIYIIFFIKMFCRNGHQSRDETDCMFAFQMHKLLFTKYKIFVYSKPNQSKWARVCLLFC